MWARSSELALSRRTFHYQKVDLRKNAKLALSKGGIGAILGNVATIGGGFALKLSNVSIVGNLFKPKLGKVDTIGAKIRPSGHYRGGFGPRLSKVGIIGGELGPKYSKVNTIGDGCGPRVDLDTLKMGGSSIPSLSGQLGGLRPNESISRNYPGHHIETFI